MSSRQILQGRCSQVFGASSNERTTHTMSHTFSLPCDCVVLQEGTVRKLGCLVPTFRDRLVWATVSGLLALAANPAAAQVPQAAAPYRLSVFAKRVAGSYTQPDSIAVSKSG